jgi:hypothetical protein
MSKTAGAHCGAGRRRRRIRWLLACDALTDPVTIGNLREVDTLWIRLSACALSLIVFGADRLTPINHYNAH